MRIARLARLSHMLGFPVGGHKYVTGFWKTLRMGFFVKTEFDAYLISSTLELTHLQV